MFLLTGLLMALIYFIWQCYTALGLRCATRNKVKISEYMFNELIQREAEWLNSTCCPLKKQENIYVDRSGKRLHLGFDPRVNEWGLVNAANQLIYSTNNINYWINNNHKIGMWIVKERESKATQNVMIKYSVCNNCGKKAQSSTHSCMYCKCWMEGHIMPDGTIKYYKW